MPDEKLDLEKLHRERLVRLNPQKGTVTSLVMRSLVAFDPCLGLTVEDYTSVF